MALMMQGARLDSQLFIAQYPRTVQDSLDLQHHSCVLKIMNHVNLSKILQPAIRQLIKKQISNGIHCADDLNSTCPREEDLSNYRLHERIFFNSNPLTEVWRHYMNISPADAWRGKSLSFGLMVSKGENLVMYSNDQFAGSGVGQVFYVNLNILGLMNIAVAHELVGIDNEQHFFELSYIEGGDSRGKQRIAFFPDLNNSTRIVHTAWFRGKSKFRDKFLYPYFHTKAITEYHGNMARSFHN